MSKITSRESLEQLRELSKKEIDNNKCRILICAGTGCIAGGSGAIYDKMCDLVASNRISKSVLSRKWPMETVISL